MKVRLPFLVYVFFTFNYAPSFAQTNSVGKQNNRFWGLHFDFHAKSTDTLIGTQVNNGLAKIINVARPEFIQVDVKGHKGFSSYPTKIGINPKGMVSDLLLRYREITRQKKVALYGHYSSILDEEAVSIHPSWGRINASGKLDTLSVSLFSNYTNAIFLPQLKELVTKYSLDGLWVDGDVWAIRPDYSEKASAAFKVFQQSSLNKKSYDGEIIKKFTQAAFLSYFSNYVNNVHSINAKFKIASNWAYSSRMPGPITVKVDYLTGDLSNYSGNPIDNACLESRIFTSQKKNWDLMSWGYLSKSKYYKTAEELKLEAALVISQGGGYSIYYPQNHDGTLPTNNLETMKAVGNFCLNRKKYCFQTNPYPQIAMLYSEFGSKCLNSYIFSDNRMGVTYVKSVLNNLLAHQYSVQILQEHQFEGIMNKYPIIIITDWVQILPTFLNKIQGYIKRGGKIVVVGQNSINIIKSVLQVTNANLKPNGYYESGKRGVYFLLNVKDLSSTVDKIFNPLVEVYSNDVFQVTINTKNKHKLIHLVNLNKKFLSHIIPRSKAVTVAFDNSLAIASVKLQPQNQVLKITTHNGKKQVVIPNGIDIYSILEIK